ncbi:MAG: nickel pincer cofactor biosynthesis protein LarC [Clostridia bacterium]|nr:nickel pincer cofactor biosynthesis protein LarC [Clostridia bacterium]
MKILYLDCGMGAAGDMLMGALLELHPNPEDFLRRLNALGLPGVQVHSERASKCGVMGTHMHVHIHGEEEHSHDVDEHAHIHEHEHEHEHNHVHEHEHEHTHEHEHHHEHESHHDHDHTHEHEHDHHHHTSLGEIQALIQTLPISRRAASDAAQVYAAIAEAEAQVHGSTIDQIHFHEVGTLDAVADVVGVCMLMDEIAPEKVYCSPVHVGSGKVKCAHGILPVPAPATALLLRDIPIYSGDIRGELCTPTGAALLRHFAHSFGNMPAISIERIGYGLGTKDFPVANCVRALLGDDGAESGRDEIIKLECNLDDMTGEGIGYAMERLFEAGARDVYTVPIHMKKNRPAQMLCCICDEAHVDAIVRRIFQHTTTTGVRRANLERYVLERHIESVDTPLGPIRVKRSTGYGTSRSKPEYDDIAAIAQREGLSLSDVEKLVK